MWNILKPVVVLMLLQIPWFKDFSPTTVQKELQAWEKEKLINIIKVDFGSEKEILKVIFNILFVLFKKIAN